MKGKDGQIRRILKLMNLPTYDLFYDLIPRDESAVTCPPEIEKMIGRFYRTLNLEKLHKENRICRVLLPMELYELLVPLETHYLLIGPFLMKAMNQEEIELNLFSSGLEGGMKILEYFQTLPYMSLSRFDELMTFFSEMLEAEKEEISFKTNDNSGEIMRQILLSLTEEEKREKAVEYYTRCARALSFRQMDELRVYAEKWEEFIEKSQSSSFSFLKEMVYNEYILMCSTYHETSLFQATPFITYLRQKLDTCSSGLELASFHREMLTVFKEHLDQDDPINLPQPLRKVRRYIRSHYRENIKLDELADEAGLSPSYLSSFFRRTCNMSITDYILSCRIGQAKRLLLYSSLPVKDTASLCGFGDAGYFTKCFKKTEGLLPEEYRRNHGGKAQQ